MKIIWKHLLSMITFYNNSGFIIFISFIFFICFIYITKSIVNKEDNWEYIKHIYIRGISNIILIFLGGMSLLWIIGIYFQTDLFVILQFDKMWKTILSILIINQLIEKGRLYRKLMFSKSLRDLEIEKELYEVQLEYNYYLNLSKHQLDVADYKMGILKSLAPLSLLTTLGGYYIQYNSKNIDWDKYSIVLLICLLYYVYQYKQTYVKVKDLKYDIFKMEQDIAKLNVSRKTSHI